MPFYEFDDGMRFSIEWSVIEGFKKHYATEQLAKRVSTSVWIETIALTQRYGFSVLNILQPIFDLENGTNLSRTKRATPFRGKLLKGLWHKHYFTARFLPANIEAGLGETGVKDILLDVMGGHVHEETTEIADQIREFARRVVMDPLHRREATATRTGEWIVYLPRQDGNYYLILATHATADEVKLQRIETECARDFPAIMTWIAEARNAR